MKLGIIGGGNIGGAILRGVMKAGRIAAGEAVVSDPDIVKASALCAPLRVRATSDNREAAAADVVVLSIKPYAYERVIAEIKPCLQKNAILISVAPGFSLDTLEAWLCGAARAVRLMPNTPAMVGEGMVALCAGHGVTREETEALKALLSPMGMIEEMPESRIDAVIGISGSAPAYVFMFIEALADAGVLYGMPSDQALRIAEQAVMGSAKLALESGKHPAVLRGEVCTPGGTTIEAVRSLEKNAFRGVVMDAVAACVEKARRMK